MIFSQYQQRKCNAVFRERCGSAADFSRFNFECNRHWPPFCPAHAVPRDPQVSVRQTAHSQAHAHAHTTLHAWLVPTGAMWQREREIRQCATVTHPKRASRKKQLEEYSRIPGGDNVRCAAHHSNPANRALVEISLYKKVTTLLTGWLRIWTEAIWVRRPWSLLMVYDPFHQTPNSFLPPLSPKQDRVGLLWTCLRKWNV